MKIAVWHNLPSGGGKRALAMHVRGLVSRGHEVQIWMPETGNSDYLPLKDVAPEHVMPFERLPAKADNPLADALLSYRRVLTEMARMDQACIRAAQEMAQGDFDVLFANSCYLYFVPPMARFTTLPGVLYLQEPNRKLYEAQPRLPWIGGEMSSTPLWKPRMLRACVLEAARLRKSRLHARYEQENARAFETVLVNSFFSPESLLRSYGLEAAVCYLGIDTAHFTYQEREREDFVLGIGALQAHKNVEFVIRAVGAMQTPRPRLVWVGNLVAAEYREYLEGLARSLDVCLELKILISDADLIDLLNRAAMLAYAPRLEPFGLAPLEANACGLPVVAVAEGGVRETVLDGVNGLLVDGDPGQMAQAIARLLADPALARRLGENGQRLAQERWSSAAAVDRLESRLQSLATKPLNTQIPGIRPMV